MAVIGKIRKHSGLLVALVGVSLVLFVLSDFLSNRGGNQGGPTEALGEIYGSDIDYADFQTEVEKIVKENFTDRGGSPSEEQMEQIRGYVWSQLVNRALYEKQFGSFGFYIGKNEMEDLIFGNNIHPDILGNEMFKDSTTGQFSVEQVKRFRQQVDQNPQYRSYWVNNIENPIRENRTVTKYFNMVSKGMYVTTSEANTDYINNTRKLKIRFVQSRYAEIPDSTITVSEEELKAWYEKNKHRKIYANMQDMRKFAYVKFSSIPSEYDVNEARKKAEKLKEAFIQSENDSDFVARYSSVNKTISDEFTSATYPADIDSLIQISDSGAVIGPYLEGDLYKVIKIRKSKMEDRYDSRHILIAYRGALRADPSVIRTKIQAKKLADSLLTAIKRDDKKFEEFVATYSSDQGSKATGGKYENILKGGGFTANYENFAMTAKKNEMKVVETEFGYHIIQALGAYKKKAISTALVDVKIVPLKETERATNEKAYEFYKLVDGKTDKFIDIAQKNKLQVEQLEISNDQKTVGDVPNGRSLASWIQRANEGDLSESIRYGDGYVIATLINIKAKGVPDLEDIRDRATVEVRNEKKGKMLAEKMKSAASLEELATRLKVQVQDAELTFNSSIIPGTNGAEHAVVGSIFSMQKPGDLSFPLVGKNAVFVVLLENIIEAPAAPDIKANQKNMINALRSRAQNDAYQALREKANIVDNRYKFF